LSKVNMATALMLYRIIDVGDFGTFWRVGYLIV